MNIPTPFWYRSIEGALSPIEPYSTMALLILAAITLWIAFKGDNVMKFTWFIYLVSP